MGFRFNASHSNDFNIAVRTTSIPYIAEKRQAVVEVQGRNGNYVFEDGYQNIEITLACAITGDSLVDRRNSARKIAEWLSNADTAQGILIFDYEPDKQYKVVKVVNGVNGVFRGALVPIDDFEIVFECSPFQQQTYENSDVTWDSLATPWEYCELAFDCNYGDIFSSSDDNTPLIMTLTNLGTRPTFPLISVIATGTSNYITIERYTPSAQSIEVTNATTKVYLDSEDEVAYTLSGGTKINKFQDIVGSFLDIQPGINEYVIYGSFDTVTVEVVYRNEYL